MAQPDRVAAAYGNRDIVGGLTVHDPALRVYQVPGPPLLDLGQFNLERLGYQVEEWFLEGTAASYDVEERGCDGRWQAQLAKRSPFTTRLVICKPREPAHAHGVVVLDWLNVSAGMDSCAEWRYLHREIIRKKMIYVGISAQRAGIAGGGMVPGPHLKLVAAERYAKLEHPGDEFSYDMFTQAARALKSSDGPLAGRRVDAVLATGSSQSAGYLVSYINAVHCAAKAIDGFLLDGRGSSGAPMKGNYLSSEAIAKFGGRRLAEAAHRIRSDTRTPTLVVQTETDVVNRGSWTARQTDADFVRIWEIAGAAHFDTYGLVAATKDDGSLTAQGLASLLVPPVDVFGTVTERRINSGPQHHYVLQSALSHLVSWITENHPPPRSRFVTIDGGPKPELVCDRWGIAMSGVRTPWVDVPTMVLSGLGQKEAGFLGLFGTSVPLSSDAISILYPDGQDEYLKLFADSTDTAVDAGYLLPEDAEEIKALSAEIGGGGDGHF